MLNLTSFHDVKKTRDGWIAKCPAHDDRKASLSIGTGADDRVLLKCHAGCELDDILAAAHLERCDLFSEKTGTTKSRIVATYPYHDEGNAHLFNVVRFDPKDFRQQRADGVWSMQGVRRVLYRLPDLQGRTVVYLVEGEKDVNALWALGLPASTNAGGAGKWRPEYSQQLKAATIEHVVILPDNDDPGRKHARDVAASCLAAGMQVKVFELPDLPVKGDVSDWLNAGHTKAELIALVKAAALYELPTSGASSNATSATVETTLRAPVVTFINTVQPEPVDWIWPGRFARGKYTLIPGEPGLGKTYLVLDTMARISRGGAFPDGAIAPRGRGLLLLAEDGLADTIRPRLDALGADLSNIAVVEAIRESDGTRSALSLTKDLDMLIAAVREVQPTFVAIDPLSAYLGRTDTHRDAEVRSALAPLLDLAEQERFALAAICHLSKDAQKAALHRPGGSIAFVAAARIVLALAADPNDPKRRLLAPIKSNICRPAATLAFRVTDDRLVWDADAVEMNVEDIFRAAAPGQREEQTDAERVIKGLLADEANWPLEAKQALEAGDAHGIPARTMRWTAKKMGIRIEKSGFGASGSWQWHRPEEPLSGKAATESPEHQNVAPIAPLQIPSKKEEEDLKSVLRGNGHSGLEITPTDANDLHPDYLWRDPEERIAAVRDDLEAGGLPVAAVERVAIHGDTSRRWATGRQPSPGDPPYGIRPTAWARHHVRVS